MAGTLATEDTGKVFRTIRAMMYLVKIAAIALLAAGCCARPASNLALPVATTQAAIDLQPGDLLFQDLDGSPLCDAIETVTDGVGGARFSHVGMVVAAGADAQVIEAGGGGVKLTPLPKFLARSRDDAGRPKVIVGRLDRKYRPLIPSAIAYAQKQLGKPYDKPFVMREDAFYCSELVYSAFAHANAGRPLFSTAPMTFKDPQTREFFPAWVDYYRGLGTPIPEGEPGLNPGGMSREPFIKIIAAFGEPALKQ